MIESQLRHLKKNLHPLCHVSTSIEPSGLAKTEGGTFTTFNQTFSLQQKIGKPLVSEDVALANAAERSWILKVLRNEYQIEFETGPVSRSLSPSLTAKKCILRDQAGRFYFLKEKPKYCCSEKLLQASAAIQDMLSEEVAWVPRIIKTKDNLPYCRIRERHYLLTPFIQGNFFSGDRGESLNASRTLAQLHAITSKAPAPTNDPRQSVIDQITCLLHIIDQMPAAELDLKMSVCAQIKKIAIEIRPPEPASRNWIHGDFAPFNLVFLNSKVVAVNDFDNVCYLNQERDIAECLLTHCGIYYLANTSSLNTPIMRYFDMTRMNDMLRKYHEVRQLSAGSIERIPHEVGIVWLELMALGICRGDFSLRDVDHAVTHAIDLVQAIKKEIII